ncbi:MAG: galactoside O-acetyltransferase [Bacteroidetes bacterium 4484_249]|nr:MAG: galactoside O-acetyltransferase [Bacteroidetes bacterium 4484_249]
MSNTSFYNREELLQMGFKSLGENVLISSNANFYSPETIEIGNNTRIDDFCLLTGRVIIGNYVHVSAYTSLYGKYGIELKDYSGLSPRVTIFSASDDFYGEYAVGPLLPQNITNVQGSKVTIGKYVQVGSGCTVLPGVQIDEGAAVGAMSLVNKNIPEWKIAAGIPAKIINERKKELVNKINSIR